MRDALTICGKVMGAGTPARPASGDEPAVEAVPGAGKPGLAVELIRDGVVVSSTVTDAAGGYVFIEQPVVEFTVKVGGKKKTMKPTGPGKAEVNFT